MNLEKTKNVGRLTLLAILAHPDDESFGPGATLAKYAQAGVKVHYLCGTRGELGSIDSEHMQGYADADEMRLFNIDFRYARVMLNHVQAPVTKQSFQSENIST